MNNQANKINMIEFFSQGPETLPGKKIFLLDAIDEQSSERVAFAFEYIVKHAFFLISGAFESAQNEGSKIEIGTDLRREKTDSNVFEERAARQYLSGTALDPSKKLTLTLFSLLQGKTQPVLIVDSKVDLWLLTVFLDALFWLSSVADSLSSEKASSTKNVQNSTKQIENKIANLNGFSDGDLIYPDYARKSRFSFELGETEFQLSPEQSSLIASVCRDHKITPDILFLSAYTLLLSKYSEEKNIAVRIPLSITGGNEKHAPSAVTFPLLVVSLSDSMSVLNLFGNINKAILDSEIPSENVLLDLHQIIDFVRSQSGVELSKYNFDYVNKVAPGNGTATPIPALSMTGDLQLSIIEANGQYSGRIVYRSDLFEDLTIDRFVESLLSTLSDIPHKVFESLANVSYLSGGQVSELISTSVSKSIPVENKLFYQYFEERVLLHPNKIAVVCGDERISYDALNRRANGLAHVLRKKGVGPEKIVGIVLDRSLDIITTIISILKTGGAYAPIDPQQPVQRIVDVASKPFINLVITEDSLVKHIPSAYSIAELLNESINASDSNLIFESDFNHLMYVLHTSGSTGAAKAVGVEHAQFMNYLHSRIDMVGNLHDANFAMVSTFAADVGHTAVFPTLADGGTLHIIKSELFHDAVELSKYFIEHNVDCLKIVCSHFQALLSATDSPDIVPSRLVIVGGVACPWSVAEDISRRNPNIFMINSFGHTETAVGATAYNIARGRKRHHGAFVPAGRPLANVEMFVLSPDKKLIPFGAVGEIFIGGERVTRGYLNSPEQTTDKFVSHPFSTIPGRRLYKTGDWGRITFDGNLEFQSRKDDQVKIRGYRIELAEIEFSLAKIQGIRKAVVLPKKNTQGETYLVAYLAANPDNEASFLTNVKSQLGEYLPKYMVPDLYCVMPDIPLDRNGKIDRKTLLSLLPFVDKSTPAENGDNSDSDIASYLKKMWAEILDCESLSVHDNFYDVGGDSLKMIQMIGRLRRDAVVQRKIAVNEIFSKPTIYELCKMIEEC